MTTLQDLIPNPELVIAMEPEDLAPYVLTVARSQMQNGMLHPTNTVILNRNAGMADNAYAKYEADVYLAVSEAFNWLKTQGLLVPAGSTNGSNGWLVLSRRARSLKTPEDLERLKQSSAFPKNLIHPSIRDKVWLNLIRGELDIAVFTAFKAVEEAVREAGGYGDGEIGVPLMRNAFDQREGPLRDPNQEKGEREALAHLFAGAIGSYKNPHSHRTVNISDPTEAQEMVVLASHLLKIVEARAAQKNPSTHA